MSRGRNSGKIVTVLDGEHKGKEGIAFNRDQHREFAKAGKVCVVIEGKKTLIEPKLLRLEGFVD